MANIEGTNLETFQFSSFIHYKNEGFINYLKVIWHRLDELINGSHQWLNHQKILSLFDKATSQLSPSKIHSFTKFFTNADLTNHLQKAVDTLKENSAPPSDGITFMSPKNFQAVKNGSGCYIKNSEGKLLFLNRIKEKKWGVPGGNIEKGETPLDAVIRETKEETGLTLAAEKVKSFGTCFLVSGKFHLAYHMFGYILSSEQENEAIKLEKDVHDTYSWRSRAEAIINAMPGTEECLNYIDKLNSLDH